MSDQAGWMMPAGHRVRYFLGLTLLICVVFLWVGSSFLMSALFRTDQEGGVIDGSTRTFDKPFAVTYINTGTFVLYLVPLVWSKIRGSKHDDADESLGTYEELRSADLDSSSRQNRSDLARPAAHVRSRSTFSVKTRRGLWKLAATFCVLWFTANWFLNASLRYTDVGIATVLSNLSGMFTLLFGAMMGVETMDWRKVLAVVFSLIGVAMITSLDTGANAGEDATIVHTSAWVGDILALLGAALYGLYTTLLKAAVPNESDLDAKQFLGYVGLLNIIGLWPLFILLDLTNLENFALPSSGLAWILVAVNALFGTCLADLLWLKALLLTTPLLVTLGLSLSIPLAVLGDVIIGSQAARDKVGAQYILGTISVVVSFLLINLLEHDRIKESEDETLQAEAE